MKSGIDFHIYAGTVRGGLIYSQCNKKLNPKFDLQDMSSEITSMEWGRSEEEIIIGNRTGEAKLYNISSCLYTNNNLTDLKGSGPVTGLGFSEDNIIVGRQNGIINIWNDKNNDTFTLNLNTDSTMECMLKNKYRDVIATGGERNDVKVWDLETKTAVFKAKSMGNDELNLPIWTSVRGLCFFPNEEQLVACATKQGHVLLYDERVQRRPVSKYIEPKACYAVMCTAYRERQCLVGTTRGYLQWLDMRTGKLIKTFKAFTGGITSVACDPTQPIVASTSLDRHLRIINLETKEMIHKEYLKLGLTKLLIRPIIKKEEDKEQQSEKSKELDDLFEDIEEIVEEVTPKKRNKMDSKKKKKFKSDDL